MNGLQERRVFLEQRLMVPQFCSNQHINHINLDNSVKESSFLCPEKPIKINHSFNNGEVTPSQEVDLSLSIGWNKQRKEACKKKSWDHIIDLEDSNKTMSLGYAARVGYSGGNHDSSSTHNIITHGHDKNQFEGTEDRSRSTVDCSASLLEQGSFSKGCCNVIIFEDMPTNTKLLHLDLNRHPEESSFPRTDLGSDSSSQATKSSCQEDAESCGNNDSNFQLGDDHDGKEGKSAEIDNNVQEGALSRLFVKSECSTRQNENDSNEQPQYSSDTFESMVLELPECNVDDSCMSSKPFEVDNADNKDCGIAVRRGRRMKDFRRDILPNLPSLSRHEISEDIRIMETVLRSREYKKMMSGMKNERKWCTPVRSKRSRLNYVGKKHHS